MDKASPLAPLRIASIDVLRAITMLLMIFVNDLWSLKDIPHWLEHTKADEDGMGLSDTIFPAFLFIVGMSIPFATQARRAKGENTASICWHIVTRSIALLIMGIYLVNGENINATASGFNRGVYNSLCCFAFILLWNTYPKTMNPWMVKALKAIAIIILIVMAVLIRGGKGGVNGFQTYWYGILGIIGWTYLVTALIYAYTEKYPALLVFIWAGLMVLCMALHSGWIESGFLRATLGFASVGGHVALAMGGVLTSLIFRHYATKGKHKQLAIILLIISGLLLALGFFTNQYWIISKIKTTPPWIFICSAITILLFILLHWLVDIKNKNKWFEIIKPAGTSTLLCYLMPYFAYAVVIISGWALPLVLLTGIVGLVKSFVFALLMVMLAGFLEKRGVRLKL